MKNEKKKLVLELDGLLPKLYCERRKCIVTREPFGEWIVLQYEACRLARG